MTFPCVVRVPHVMDVPDLLVCTVGCEVAITVGGPLAMLWQMSLYMLLFLPGNQ